jgi:hypothetical protein
MSHSILLETVFYGGSLDAEILGHSETQPRNIKGVISFDSGLLYEPAVLLTTKKLVLPAGTNAGGPLVLSTMGRSTGFETAISAHVAHRKQWSTSS